MSVVRKTLEENYLFFIRELDRVNEEIGKLPAGNISAKKIGKSVYYYLQWREGKKIKTTSLGAMPPDDLRQQVSRRRQLEQQKKEIMENIATITKAIDIQRVTVDEIIRLFALQGISAVLIGSYCLPLMKETTGFNLPTIRTQDVDFLISSPYRGKEVDIESVLKPLGFAIGFNPDGSTYFSNGIFKVEFLTPEKGKGSDKAIAIRALKIRATPLRFLQMLFDSTMNIEVEGKSFAIPNPWTLAYHKILVSKHRKSGAKKDKDLMQALAILREVLKRPDLSGKALAYLEKLPQKWAKQIRLVIAKEVPGLLKK
jgi:hypothetical protein